MKKIIKEVSPESTQVDNMESVSSTFDLILSKLKHLTSDYQTNLQILTNLAGEMLNADYSLYKRLTESTIHNICMWNKPNDFQYLEEHQNTISYDVIFNYPDDFCLITDLPETKYALSVPAINRKGLVTYVGHKINYDNQCRGIICNLYYKDYKPTTEEKSILELIAAFIGIEESRASATESYTNSETKYKKLYTMLRLICDNEPDMIWAKDIETKYLFANKAMCDCLLHATSTDEPVGKTDMFFAERIRREKLEDPEWHTFGEICRDTDHITMNTMAPQRFDEYGNVRGEFLRLDVHKAPLLDITGSLIGTVGSARDVTRDKMIEQALIDSQSRYKALLEANPDLMFLVTLDGKIIDYKANSNTVLHSQPEQFLNQSVRSSLPQDVAELVLSMIDLANQTQAVQSSEYSIESQNELMFFECRMAPCGNDNFLAIVRDITENKSAANAIRESEAMFRRVVETSNEGIWMMDENCATTYVNSKMLEMLACTESDIVGFPVEKWMYTEDLDEHYKKMRERQAGHKDSYERRFRRMDGVEVWALVSATSVMNENGVYKGSFGMFTDITERKLTEKALQESQEQYRILFDHAPVSIVVHSEDKIIFANPAATRLIMADNSNQLIGMTVMDFIHPEYQEIARTGLNRLVRGEINTTPTEYYFKRLDGSYIPVEVFANLLTYQNKTAVQLMISDTSERKKNESLIIRNEARLKSIIKVLQYRSETLREFLDYSLQEAIKLTDSMYGCIFYNTDASNELEVITWSENPITNCKTEKTKHIFPLDKVDVWREVVRQEKPIILNDFLGSKLLKSGQSPGESYYTKFLAIPVYSDGSIVATLGVANKTSDYNETDVLQLTLLMEAVWRVVDRKKKEDELHKLTRAVEQSPVSIIITDTKGNIEYVNEFFTKITGYTLEEAKGKNTKVFKSGETDRETYNTLWNCIKAGNTWTGEFHNRKKNGDLYWEEASISPVTNSEGKITHFVAVKEDITKRKQITQELVSAKEEAIQMNRLKSTFLANMSHELRTPLVGILGFSELLPTVMDNPEAIDMARTIHSSGRRLLNTLNLILDLSRIEANKQEIKWQTIELNQFVQGIIRLFDAVALQKGISLKFMSKIQPLYLLTDRSLLEHVVNDLINNALKYTNIGSVMVRLTIDPHDDRKRVQIKVIDTGIGIPKQQQTLIFDAFRQASEGYERSYEGTGLGLTISHRYIELLGGNISVSSEPGLGSEFTISFPDKHFQNEIVASDEREAKLTSDAVQDSPSEKILPRILLIDDDEISHLLTSRMLAGVADVDYANTGESGLKAIRSNKYRAVLLDIYLRKGMSGLNVLTEIKKMVLYSEVPIVAVTAFSMLGDKETFIEQGFSHYLSKPFTKEELVELVREIII